MWIFPLPKEWKYFTISVYFNVQFNYWYEKADQMWRTRSLTNAKKMQYTFKDLDTKPVELKNKDRGTKFTFPLFQ